MSVHIFLSAAGSEKSILYYFEVGTLIVDGRGDKQVQ